MRIEPGYFMYDDLEYDRSEETKEAIPRAWDPAIVSHPLSDPFFDHSQPSESVIVSRDATPWMITLYGLMPVFPIYGSEMWELRAEATLDPDTCEATLESLVAGPDEIVLYPEDEG